MAVNNDFFYALPESISQVSCNIESEQVDRTMDLEKRIASADEDLRFLEYAHWLFRSFPPGNVGIFTDDASFWCTEREINETATRVYDLRPLQ